jgi:hypothetical protein
MELTGGSYERNKRLCINGGSKNMTYFKKTSGQIPVSDGTLNINLNTDMIDGYHASDFVLKAEQRITTKESFVLTETDIANKYITLSHTPQVVLLVYDVIVAEENIDYYIDGNQIKWDGMQFETNLNAGDKINVIYIY